MPIFEKISHPIRPVEGLKLSLDFLCNTDIIFIIFQGAIRGRVQTTWTEFWVILTPFPPM